MHKPFRYAKHIGMAREMTKPNQPTAPISSSPEITKQTHNRIKFAIIQSVISLHFISFYFILFSKSPINSLLNLCLILFLCFACAAHRTALRFCHRMGKRIGIWKKFIFFPGKYLLELLAGAGPTKATAKPGKTTAKPRHDAHPSIDWPYAQWCWFWNAHTMRHRGRAFHKQNICQIGLTANKRIYFAKVCARS